VLGENGAGLQAFFARDKHLPGEGTEAALAVFFLLPASTC